MSEARLHFSDGRVFAVGQTPYLDHFGDTPILPRIVVSVRVGDCPVQAVVDTGGAYFICDPAILDWGDIPLGPAEGSARLTIRGRKIPGSLHRLGVVLEAEVGKDIEFEVTTFVPELKQDDEWRFPIFLGLQGCLERVRFAVDPETNTFYFGPLGELY